MSIFTTVCMGVSLTMMIASLILLKLSRRPKKESRLQDFEKVLLLLHVRDPEKLIGQGLVPKGDVDLAMLLLDWDEKRVRMALARLEEFGFASKDKAHEGT